MRSKIHVLESGITTVNGKIAKPDTILSDGDRLECPSLAQLKKYYQEQTCLGTSHDIFAEGTSI